MGTKQRPNTQKKIDNILTDKTFFHETPFSTRHHFDKKNVFSIRIKMQQFEKLKLDRPISEVNIAFVRIVCTRQFNKTKPTHHPFSSS